MMDWQYEYKHTVLVLCTCAFFVTMVARLVISPIIPLITDEFVVGNAEVGFALTGMWMAYAATQYPSGVLGDRFSGRSIVLVSVGGTALVSLLIALSPQFSVFFLFVVVLGGVAGLHYNAATTLLGRLYENLAFAVGIHTIGSSMGGLIAPIVAVWIGVRYGWRPAIAFTAVIAIPIFLLFAWRVRSMPPLRPDQPLRDRLDVAEVEGVLRKPQIAFTLLIAGLCAFVWQGIASFLPAFLVGHRGVSATMAGGIFTAYFLIQSLAKPGIGSVADRFGRDITTVGCMVASALGLVLFVIIPGVVGTIGGVVLAGIGLNWMVPVEPRFLNYMPEQERGVGFGLVRTVYLIIGSFGSIAVGFFADVLGWTVAFGFLIFLLSLVVVALVVNWTLGLGY